jgi:hypothetical protein
LETATAAADDLVALIMHSLNPDGRELFGSALPSHALVGVLDRGDGIVRRSRVYATSIRSAARSAIATTVAFGLALIMSGMTEASATHRDEVFATGPPPLQQCRGRCGFGEGAGAFADSVYTMSNGRP